MTCAEFLRNYTEYTDGSLSNTDRLRLAAHAQDCPNCQRFERALTEGVRTYREAPRPEPSGDFMRRLEHRLYHVQDGRWLNRAGGVWAAGVFGAAAVAVLAVGWSSFAASWSGSNGQILFDDGTGAGEAMTAGGPPGDGSGSGGANPEADCEEGEGLDCLTSRDWRAVLRVDPGSGSGSASAADPVADSLVPGDPDMIFLPVPLIGGNPLTDGLRLYREGAVWGDSAAAAGATGGAGPPDSVPGSSGAGSDPPEPGSGPPDSLTPP